MNIKAVIVYKIIKIMSGIYIYYILQITVCFTYIFGINSYHTDRPGTW